MRPLPTPLANPVVLEDLLEKTRQSDTVGDLVTFSASDVQIAPEDLRDLLRLYGIEEWEPVPIRTKTAMRKALTLIKPRLEDGDDLKILVRKVVEDDQELVYALVDEALDYVKVDLDYKTRNHIIFSKETGEISFTKEEIPEVVELYEYLCSVYTQRELIYITKNIILGYGGFPIENSGGMYFMPVAVREIVDALRGLYNEGIDERYGKAYFRALGIVNTEEVQQTMSEVALETLSQDLADAETHLNYVLSSPTSRVSTITSAVNRFKVLMNRATMYQEILGFDPTEVAERFEDASHRATEVLMQRQDARIGVVPEATD